MKNPFLFFRALHPVMLTGALLLLPVLASGQSAAKLAGLEQDVTAMREEIQKLREEVQDMRVALAAVRAQSNTSGQSGAAVQQQLNAHANAVNQALQAQDAETKRRLTVMATETNKAIAALDKKVDAALGSRPVGNSTGAVANDDSTPPAIPSNMPQNGITYVVKSGDTISKIASANSSRTDWILAANKLTAKSVRNLPIGTKLFIPQRNTAPQPPQQPANATN